MKDSKKKPRANYITILNTLEMKKTLMQVFTWGNLWAMPSTDKKEKYCHAMVIECVTSTFTIFGGGGGSAE